MPTDTSNAHTGLSDFEAPEHQPCVYGKQGARKCARCTRAADKRRCVHRTQLAQSFSRICWSSKETAESKRTVTCKHTHAQTSNSSPPNQQRFHQAGGGDEPPDGGLLHGIIGSPRQIRSRLGLVHRDRCRGACESTMATCANEHVAAAATPELAL